METLAVLVGVSLALGLLARAAKSTARIAGGDAVLEYRRVFMALPLLGWLLVAVLVAAAVADPTERHLAYFVVPAFVLMALFLQLEFSRVRITFGRSGIQTLSPWRAPRTIPWESIRRVTYSRLMQWYAIETDGYGSVRLPLYLSGKESLLSELERRGFELPGRSA